MAKPVNTLATRTADVAGSIVNLSDLCGGKATLEGLRGYDGSDWLAWANFGYVTKAYGDEYELRRLIPFADSGTVPFQTNAAGPRQSVARYWSDDTSGFDGSYMAVQLNGSGANWFGYNIPQINSGFKWTLKATTSLRTMVVSLSCFGSAYTVTTTLSNARARTAAPNKTLVLTPGSYAVQSFTTSWRGLDAGDEFTIEIRKTDAGVGYLGIEYAYIPISVAPVRARGFGKSFAARAAFGGRNE